MMGGRGDTAVGAPLGTHRRRPVGRILGLGWDIGISQRPAQQGRHVLVRAGQQRIVGKT
jgi:hypothetical protein